MFQDREHWNSQVGFVLAAAGSAIGLGNLWKFPYVAGDNGGGAFVLVYIIILFVVGFTLMLAEILLGRYAQTNVVGAYRKIRYRWSWVGLMGVFTGFLILSFYSVIGGWVVSYLVKAIGGSLQVAPSEFEQVFNNLVSGTIEPIMFHAIFMFLTLLIVLGGIQKGIETATKIMMPGLFVMIIVLAIRSVTLPGAIAGVRYLFVPDFSQITIDVILDALGQVFFSLSLGMGAMITYGSYLSKKTNLGKTTAVIPLLDTLIALVAGLATLPAVFAFNIGPSSGPSLMFITLPAVFSQLPFGQLFAILFFSLVLFAAVSSSISLLEVVVSFAVDEWKWTRKKATWTLATVVFIVGIPAVLSFGPWAEVNLLPGRNFFDSYDFLTSNILLPLGGLLLSILIGWVWGVDNALNEITNGGAVQFRLGRLWGFAIRYIAPLAIGIIFIRALL